uniref:Dynactin subunit 6 n=1 Tax=Meleagris gallopavo TaxID=9103 RepID=A0A803XWE7_MELGA
MSLGLNPKPQAFSLDSSNLKTGPKSLISCPLEADNFISPSNPKQGTESEFQPQVRCRGAMPGPGARGPAGKLGRGAGSSERPDRGGNRQQKRAIGGQKFLLLPSSWDPQLRAPPVPRRSPVSRAELGDRRTGCRADRGETRLVRPANAAPRPGLPGTEYSKAASENPAPSGGGARRLRRQKRHGGEGAEEREDRTGSRGVCGERDPWGCHHRYPENITPETEEVEPKPMIIGTNNVFEVGCYSQAMKVGDNNVIESKAFVGRNVILTSGCIIGACCNVNTYEVIPENTVIYGADCLRRVQTERPQPQTLQLDFLMKILPNYHHLKKTMKAASTPVKS